MTVWATGDKLDPDRLNQKSRFIGTGPQATNLIATPQVGQEVYPSTSDGEFTHDKLHIRNSADDTWLAGNIDVTAEGVLGTSSNSQNYNAAGKKAFATTQTFTLPTTEKFYIITAVEFDNKSGGANYICGVDIGSPQTGTLVALGLEQVLPSAGVLKVPCVSKILRGGTTIYPWVNANSLCDIGADTSASQSYISQAYTTTPPYAYPGTYASSLGTVPKYAVYYVGFN